MTLLHFLLQDIQRKTQELQAQKLLSISSLSNSMFPLEKRLKEDSECNG